MIKESKATSADDRPLMLSEGVSGTALVGSLPVHYERDQRWAVKSPYTTAANRYTLLSPNRLTVNINNSGYALLEQIEIDLSVAANWDSIITDYRVAATRAGKDFYIYACQQDGSVPKILLSPNSTVPSGYTADNSRKIGGFHCLCAGVGTISGHALTGFVLGDIIPDSVWDLKHRPVADPAGMVWSEEAGIWVDIYLASGTGANTASVNGGTISDTRTWLDFVDDGMAVKKRMMRDWEFQVIAALSNEETNIYGSQDPVIAGKCAPKLFTGSGLNDLTVNRANFSHANEAQEYEVEIDGTGTPDTFKWRQRNFGGAWGGYTSTVAITGAAQILADGLTVTIAATTGHTLGSKWNIYCMDGLRDTANRRMISKYGCEGCCGVMWQWLDEQSYRYDLGTPTYSAAGQTLTIYHAAAPGGNPVYMKFTNDGTPYLCCNMAIDTADKVITFGTNYKIVIKHDADAATGIQVFFDYDAGSPLRLLANNTIHGKNVYVFTIDPNFLLPIKHDASAATNGVAINYDDDSDERLEYISPGSVNATIDLAISGPTWGYYDLPGAKGSFYQQAPYGDVKLLAGAAWGAAASSGSRARGAAYYRWLADTSRGGRFASEPKYRET